MLNFDRIDTEKDRDTVVKFRKDSFIVSFGNASGFGSEENYLSWLADKIRQFPHGFLLVKENDQAVGQLELSIREFEGKNIGYVHLYYLIPDKRGSGLGKHLHDYALDFFKKQNVKEYHLRVSPSNKQAINFYKKIGMEAMGEEVDGKVIRMRGTI